MAELFNTPSIQASAVPAGGAITSARSLAKHYASLIGDGVDGVRLLPLARTTLATTLETDAYDQTHKAPIRKGLGYLLGDNGIAMGGRSNSFGHSGSAVRTGSRSGLRFEFRAHQESTGCHDASRGSGLGRLGEYGARSLVRPERLTNADLVTKTIDKQRVALCTFTFRWTWKASQELRRSTR